MEKYMLGNLVEQGEIVKILKFSVVVKSLDPDDIVSIDVVDYQSVRGIPLENYLLEKHCDKCIEHRDGKYVSWLINNSGDYVCLNPRGFFLVLVDRISSDDESVLSLNIKYVHELQNLLSVLGVDSTILS